MNKKIMFLMLSCTIISQATCSETELEQYGLIPALESSIKSKQLNLQKELTRFSMLRIAESCSIITSNFSLMGIYCSLGYMCGEILNREFAGHQITNQNIGAATRSLARSTGVYITSNAVKYLLNNHLANKATEIRTLLNSRNANLKTLQQLKEQQLSNQ